MDFLSWTAEGMKIYLQDQVLFYTYDQVAVYVAIIGITLGLMFGTVIAYYSRVNAYRAVRALVSEGCNTAETAKMIGELSTPHKRQLKSALKDGSLLRKCVDVVDSGKGKKKKTDFSIAKFYIPEEKRISAETRHSREGLNPVSLVVTVVVIAVVGGAALVVVPNLITMAENVFGNNNL